MSERDDADFDYIAHDYDLEPDIGPEPRTGDHMSLDTTINLHDPLAEICTLLGLDPKNVLHFDIHPDHLTARICDLNEHGAKYVIPETGEVATRTLHYEIRT
jgi:hypothetical protein